MPVEMNSVQPVEGIIGGTPISVSGTVVLGVSTLVCSTALEASHVISAAAATLLSVSGRLDSTAATGTYYVQALNAASLPANGAVTHLCTPAKIVHVSGVDDFFAFNIPSGGINATTGVVVALSSTEFTLTIGGAYMSLDGCVRS